MSIFFETPGHLDLEAAFTFGVNAKVNENSIGHFGTGLKFAIATLLRSGHKIRLTVGGEQHDITVVNMDYRGKEFGAVHLDGRSLNFTTALGKGWETWMAFRELCSNTLDEKGISSDGVLLPDEDNTIIEIEGEDIEKAYQKRHEIFCDSCIIAAGPSLEVRQGSSQYFYYRGVRVFTLPKKSRHTLNMLNGLELTEDRTLKEEYWLKYKLGTAFSEMHDQELLCRVLTERDSAYEADVLYDWVASPTPAFLQAVKDCYPVQGMSVSARKMADNLKLIPPRDIEMDEVQRQQFVAAKEFLARIGYDVDRYPIKFAELNGPLGVAKEGKIFISPAAFRMGTKYVAGTLFEEFLHLSENCEDNTRKMQNILIDTIMSLGEKLIGKPI